MLALLSANPIAFAIIFPGLLLSIAFHEFAHAWAADKLGDPTPRYQGRVTLNPLSHLDPLGTLAIFLTNFGWGRPVQFDPYNLKEPVRDTALIALAGPMTNVALAIGLSLMINFNVIPWLSGGLFQLLLINIVLAVFNLVPVYPLDGSKILLALLPAGTALEYERFMSRYGILVLILLILPLGGRSPVASLILPVVNLIVGLLVV
ncbi:MAG: site-2 protease family protein [Candidatus Pacebacteria bacterium CG10_big_fil_rev_8_21_14_0_10_56_10]|nr:MAG: site-2 protease family protein [Candidatus Pacebacteria bacterium CG10_big_fil_rev_8_21_14_0_10_56_10]